MKSLIPICMLFYVSFVLAQDWDAEYKQLCSYDQDWCPRLKNSDGTWVRPKPEIVKIIEALAPDIKKAGDKLGVSPVAIAGAILAENSLNVSVSDDVQDLLVKLGVADRGEILGKKFTFGLGQLNFSAAREAENYVAELENRKPLDDQTLQNALLIPERSVYFVGAVMRKVQDDYKKEGFDISGKADLLTSLYNLGNSEKRAADAKSLKRDPRSNYFGFFVKKYEKNLSFLTTEEKSNELNQENTINERFSSNIIPKSEAGQVKTPESVKKVMVEVFNLSMPLYTSPPTCENESGYGAINLKNKYSSMKNFPVVAVAEKDTSFKKIAPTIDCEANTWQLIELDNGKVGWIKENDLKKNISKAYIAEKKCKTVEDAQSCFDKVKKEQDAVLETDANNLLLYLKPFSKGKASFASTDWECTDDSNGVQGGGYGGMGLGAGQNRGISFDQALQFVPDVVPKKKRVTPISDLKTIKAQFEKRISDIEKFFQADINHPKNPYKNMFNGISERMQDCVSMQEYNVGPCEIDINKLKVFINEGMVLKKKLSSDDRDFISYNTVNLLTAIPLKDKKEIAAIKQSGGGFGYIGQVGVYHLAPPESQYRFSEGDETKWSINDLESTLRSCIDSTKAIELKLNNDPDIAKDKKQEMVGILSMMSVDTYEIALAHIDVIKHDDTEQGKKAWNKIHPHIIQLVKLCIGTANNFDVKMTNLTAAGEEYNCYMDELEVLENNMMLISKEIKKDQLKTLEGLRSLKHQAGMLYNTYVIDKLITYIGRQSAPTRDQEQVEDKGSFCPNRTAEQIEELLEKNPCIQRIYLPDDWMLNRLNAHSSKIIKRPFEKDDRFAVDFGGQVCN